VEWSIVIQDKDKRGLLYKWQWNIRLNKLRGMYIYTQL
jgi:hypothetical protein